MSDVYIVGIDMIPFGRYPERSVPELGAQAALLALDDARLGIRDMQATILHLLGLDPYRFHFTYQGLDNRLIGPTSEGKVLKALLA